MKYKDMSSAEYLIWDIFTEEISLSSKPINNKLLADETDEDFDEDDEPDTWFKSFFDDIYECT